MSGKEHTRAVWEGLLDPSVLRPRLIKAALFVTTFEMLRHSIVGRLRDFFHAGSGAAATEHSAEYRDEVLNRNRSTLYASLAWLREMEAVDEADLASFEAAKSYRNVCAHELPRIACQDGLPDGFEPTFQAMVALMHKIESWWVINVDVATDPEWSQQEVSQQDVVPGSTLLLQIISQVALGSQQDAQWFLDEWRKRGGGA